MGGLRFKGLTNVADLPHHTMARLPMGAAILSCKHPVLGKQGPSFAKGKGLPTGHSADFTGLSRYCSTVRFWAFTNYKTLACLRA